MELFAYEPLLTTDGVRPVPGAVVGFYADADTGFKAPLEVFTLEGKSLGFSPVADKNGYINNAGGYMLPVQYGKSKSGKLPAVPVFSVRSVIEDGKTAAADARAARVAAEKAVAGAQIPENGARPIGKGELVINVKDYGAKGDGIADDSDALQAWINAGGTTLTNGVYRITKTLNITQNNSRLICDNARLVADTVNMACLLVSANKASISVHIDGSSKASQAVTVTGSECRIFDSTIENLRSDTITARGIEAITAGGVTVENCIIRNIYSKPNGATGDNPGSSRAIVLTNSLPAAKYSVIRNNIIENIFGEEGDAITVQFIQNGGGTKFLSGKVSIRNNQFRTVSRRFIKIQACDVNVDSNVLEFDLATTEPILAGGAISAIQSDNVNIINNVIYPNLINAPIAVTGNSGDYAKGITVAGNTILQGDAQASIGIYMDSVDGPIIKGNTVTGGTEVTIAITNTRNALIEANTIKGGSAAARPIQSAASEGTVIRLNSVMSPRGAIRNLSTNPVTELNYSAPAV